jgi:hypothetical protein
MFAQKLRHIKITLGLHDIKAHDVWRLANLSLTFGSIAVTEKHTTTSMIKTRPNALTLHQTS